MNVENVNIADLKPYEKNAKKHSEKQIDAIKNSIKEFGFRQPVVIDSKNEIIIGHGRYEAAKKLGMTEVPCVTVSDLSEKQVKALRIADNKLNESDWDLGLLSEELDELSNIDMTDFGFNEAELLEIQIDNSFSEPTSTESSFSTAQSPASESIPSFTENASATSFEAQRPAPSLSQNDGEISREEIQTYKEKANNSGLITKRVILIYKDDEEDAVKKLLGVKQDEQLNVIYKVGELNIG
jgi:hypothetical protein